MTVDNTINTTFGSDSINNTDFIQSRNITFSYFRESCHMTNDVFLYLLEVISLLKKHRMTWNQNFRYRKDPLLYISDTLNNRIPRNPRNAVYTPRNAHMIHQDAF